MMKIATETKHIEHKGQNKKKSINLSLLNMYFVNRCRCTTVNNDYNDPFFKRISNQ